MRTRDKPILTVAFIIATVVFNLLSLKANANGVPDDIREYAEEIGAEYGICPELLESIAYWESRFDPTAVSKNGKYIGLMQVNPKIHADRMKKLGVDDLTDPKGCMRVAADYLLELFEEHEDAGIVLCYYNGVNTERIGKYEQTGNIPRYVEKVLKLSEVYERMHGH